MHATIVEIYSLNTGASPPEVILNDIALIQIRVTSNLCSGFIRTKR